MSLYLAITPLLFGYRSELIKGDFAASKVLLDWTTSFYYHFPPVRMAGITVRLEMNVHQKQWIEEQIP